jgi:hypothetical protein
VVCVVVCECVCFCGGWVGGCACVCVCGGGGGIFIKRILVSHSADTTEGLQSVLVSPTINQLTFAMKLIGLFVCFSFLFCFCLAVTIN